MPEDNIKICSENWLYAPWEVHMEAERRIEKRVHDPSREGEWINPRSVLLEVWREHRSQTIRMEVETDAPNAVRVQ